MTGDFRVTRRIRSFRDGPGDQPLPLTFSLGSAALFASTLGCAPTVNVVGTYFPPSMVSAAIGLIASYLFVRILARRPALRPLAQSALLFLSITTIVGFLAWWSFFREF